MMRENYLEKRKNDQSFEEYLLSFLKEHFNNEYTLKEFNIIPLDFKKPPNKMVASIVLEKEEKGQQ